jgi:outer membrane protein assembly factor BamC
VFPKKTSVSKYSVSKLLLTMAAVSVVVNVAGCSRVSSLVKLPDHKIDYKNSRTVQPLDVPPDLSTPEYDQTYAAVDGTVSASDYARRQQVGQVAGNSSVLPAVQGVQVVNQGGVRFLQVQAPAEQLWPKLKSFWNKLGVGLKKDEPRIGIMETEWAENRAGLPKDWLRKLTGSVFSDSYDAGSRDKFRLRVERAGAGITNVYVTHQRAEEIVTNDVSGVKWQLKPADSEVEAEMLNRIVAHLQGGNAAAKVPVVQQAASTATMTTASGKPALQISGRFSDVWLRTGVMIERIGMSIEGQQKQAGIYTVIYRGGERKRKEGWFSRIFKSDKSMLKKGGEYQLHIADNGSSSLISVANKEGDPVAANVSSHILAQLKSEFDR